MAKRRGITSDLYRMARASNTLRAASRGPVPLAKRAVRRKAYAKSGGATRAILRAFGLSR